jgi:hypothetical protein
MQTSPNAQQSHQKAFSDIVAVLRGTKDEATVQVTPETIPVLEFFLGQAHHRIQKMEKGGL